MMVSSTYIVSPSVISGARLGATGRMAAHFDWETHCSGIAMARQLGTLRHDALRQFLADERRRAASAEPSLRSVSWSPRTVLRIENGEKRVMAVELLALADALSFDAAVAVRRLMRAR